VCRSSGFSSRHQICPMRSAGEKLVFILFIIIALVSQGKGLIANNNQQDSIEAIIASHKGKKQVELLISLADKSVVLEPQTGLMYASRAEAIARKNKYFFLLSDALKIKADALFYLDSLQASLEAYLQSAEIDQSVSHHRADSLMKRLADVGYVYSELGMFDKAIEFHSSALEMSKGLKDTAEMASNLSNLGVSFKMTGNYDKAIDCFLQTLLLDELTGNEADYSITCNAIAMVYFDWGKYEMALEFLEKALKKDTELGDESKIAIRLSNISQTYHAMHRYEEAISYLQQALEIDRRLNNRLKIAIRLHVLGLIQRSQGNKNEALNCFKEAIPILRSLNAEYNLAPLLVHMGALYHEMNNWDDAEHHLLEGFTISDRINLRTTKMEAAKELSGIYKDQQRCIDAFRVYEIYKTIEDSVFNEESARQINEFEVKYETEKKERINQLLIKENEIQRKTQRYFLALSGILVLLLATTTWAFFLKRISLNQSRKLFAKERELAQLKLKAVENHNRHLNDLLFAEEEIKMLQAEQLDQKNHELTATTMLLANKNEVLNKLRRLTEETKNYIVDDGKTKLREIIGEIDRQTNLESQWDDFKIHFESIHKDFFATLLKKHPDLTQSDLQLCAYIRLNLSTKEISRLMNIAHKSVNIHRYRLRKKLLLTPDTSLNEFIHAL
jgi:tetratricopeptide (TPR) repeat protein